MNDWSIPVQPVDLESNLSLVMALLTGGGSIYLWLAKLAFARRSARPAALAPSVGMRR
jgi:hypothetical protein